MKQEISEFAQEFYKEFVRVETKIVPAKNINGKTGIELSDGEISDYIRLIRTQRDHSRFYKSKIYPSGELAFINHWKTKSLLNGSNLYFSPKRDITIDLKSIRKLPNILVRYIGQNIRMENLYEPAITILESDSLFRYEGNNKKVETFTTDEDNKFYKPKNLEIFDLIHNLVISGVGKYKGKDFGVGFVPVYLTERKGPKMHYLTVLIENAKSCQIIKKAQIISNNGYTIMAAR